MFLYQRGRWLLAFLFVPLYFLVQWISHYPEAVETFYSKGFYKAWAHAIRFVFGYIPFSVGDLFYIILILWSGKKIIAIAKGQSPIPRLLQFLAMGFSVLYLGFNLSWGLNYYRVPLHKTMGLSLVQKDSNALLNLTKELVLKTNAIHQQLSKDTSLAVKVPYNTSHILNIAPKGVKKIGKTYPIFAYRNPAVKKSIFATPLSYMGYAGYLNPFSLEAQVNQKIPLYRLPVVATHEIGHQLGYASERDTNFIGYLAAYSHPDPYFNYAATTLALSYCLRDLQRENPEAYKVLLKTMYSGVFKNYKESSLFWTAHKNPLMPYFDKLFNSFLKINHQAKGIKSYGQVVQLLLAYHQKHPLE